MPRPPRRRGLRRAQLLAVGLLALVRPAPGALAAAPQAAQSPDNPDRLFDLREREPVQRAAASWKVRLASNPGDAEAAWKLSRALYWLGANGAESRDLRRPLLEEGVAAARRAMAIAPAEPHGHFWLAANMGMLSELFGRREGLRYRADIKRALETTLAADPGYLHGAAQRALGRWFATVPAMFGGDKLAGETHLRAALAAKRDSAITMVLLAELLLGTGRPDEAGTLLTAALTAPPDPEWTPEDLRFKARAKELLAGLTKPSR